MLAPFPRLPCSTGGDDQPPRHTRSSRPAAPSGTSPRSPCSGNLGQPGRMGRRGCGRFHARSSASAMGTRRTRARVDRDAGPLGRSGPTTSCSLRHCQGGSGLVSAQTPACAACAARSVSARTRSPGALGPARPIPARTSAAFTSVPSDEARPRTRSDRSARRGPRLTVRLSASRSVSAFASGAAALRELGAVDAFEPIDEAAVGAHADGVAVVDRYDRAGDRRARAVKLPQAIERMHAMRRRASSVCTDGDSAPKDPRSRLDQSSSGRVAERARLRAVGAGCTSTATSTGAAPVSPCASVRGAGWSPPRRPRAWMRKGQARRGSNRTKAT